MRLPTASSPGKYLRANASFTTTDTLPATDPNATDSADLIIGINGKGLTENPIGRWRRVFFSTDEKNDYKMSVTLYRDGKIQTVDLEPVPGGREAVRKQREQKEEFDKANKGLYYRLMMEHVRKVLADPAKYHPAYDPEKGYEISGFVWFQGYNDAADRITYPNRQDPRGYEQYSWLLSHLIRDVRKDLKTPELPFVIGVMGVGGKKTEPDPFREAMAAPASMDEFKGNVIAVRTAQFCDEKLAELQRKNPKTPEEEMYIKNNSSGQGFHYKGSP